MTDRLTRLASILLLAALCSAGPMVPVSRAQFADVQGDAATAAPDDDSQQQAAVPALSADDLRTLVAPVALYPDELLAIVLPASTNPLQVVQAQRFLEKQKADPSLKPDQSWDPAIIALLNYPQVIKQLNDDLDWTEQLGNAVMDQQEDVLNAIQAARSDASSAGYLKSNDQQVVVNNNDNITIQSAQPNVVYVPTYDPQTVVTNNYVNYPPPVYSAPYPAYYAPGATFFAGAIVGATFAYAFDWDHHDIDIDCCDHGDIDIDNDINIDRGDINIGSGNVDIDRTNIQNRFNGDRTKAGSDGKMKWSSQKARQKSTAVRKPAARPTSAGISKSLGNSRPAGKIQSGKVAQKDAVRGQNSLKTTKNPKANINKPALHKQQKPQLDRQTQRPQNKAMQQKQLRQKQGSGGAFGQMAPQRQVKAQSNRGSRSLSSGGQVRPKRR